MASYPQSHRPDTREQTHTILANSNDLHAFNYIPDLEREFTASSIPWNSRQYSPMFCAAVEAANAARDALPVQRLQEYNAPAILVIAEQAAAAYEIYKSKTKPHGGPLEPVEWMSAQDPICTLLGFDRDEIRQFRYWSRVARLSDIITQTFESNAHRLGLCKYSAPGKPTLYVGADRQTTATLSGLYFKTVSEVCERICVLFACDTSNGDMYDAFLKLGGRPSRFGFVTHIDEYVLTNLDKPRILTEEHYPESFVVQSRKTWDKMGIPQKRRLEIDGLSDNPERVAAALSAFYEDLNSRRVWSHLILGLGPEERPHIIFLDDLGDPPHYFNSAAHVELSEYVQRRDISRGQQPHSHAISLGGLEALSRTSIQQTFYADADGTPSKARGLVKALSQFPPHRNHSVGLCHFAPSRWRFFTDAKSAAVILDSGIYSRN